MSTSALILSFIGFIRIIKYLVDEFEGKPPIITAVPANKRAHRTVQFISNGQDLPTSIRKHYYHLLDLQSKPVIHCGIVAESFRLQVKFLEEDQMLGYKVKCSTQDLEAAKDYLLDLCDYFGNLN